MAVTKYITPPLSTPPRTETQAENAISVPYRIIYWPLIMASTGGETSGTRGLQDEMAGTSDGSADPTTNLPVSEKIDLQKEEKQNTNSKDNNKASQSDPPNVPALRHPQPRRSIILGRNIIPFSSPDYPRGNPDRQSPNPFKTPKSRGLVAGRPGGNIDARTDIFDQSLPRGNPDRPSPPLFKSEMKKALGGALSDIGFYPDENIEDEKEDGSAEYPVPPLFHRVRHTSSILALVVGKSIVYAGTQDGEILVWSLETCELLATIKAHRRAVLALCLSPDRKRLFSSAGDALVNVWCTEKLECVFSIYSTYDIGDVFSVAYSADLDTVYLGAMNTSIQWYDLKEKDTRPPPNPAAHPFDRNHRFFSSVGPGGVGTPRPAEENITRATGARTLEIDKEHIVQYAHYGYVYCMLLARGFSRKGPENEVLISGGGNGTVKLWELHADHSGAISELAVLDNGEFSVLSIALSGTFLYAGLLEGDINVWDLDTMQLIRNVKAHTEDVLAVSIGGGYIYSGGASGYSRKFDKRNDCLARWSTCDGLILASTVTKTRGGYFYITGGNDNCICVWEMGACEPEGEGEGDMKRPDEQLLGSVEKMVSYKTVSSGCKWREDCRRCATYLRSLFKGFGATTEMLSTEEGYNPVVYARFNGKPGSTKTRRKRLLFYGHYDVISAEKEPSTWKTDPFKMDRVNGYLYGRGVSDNKGPVLAALYAAADLVAEQKLEFDIVFLIEGEEECGSRGFEKAVKENKHLIGEVDWILLANSYWLDDEIPCLTYGLRGVIHATISVHNDQPDLHSGVDGSPHIEEPLQDLVAIMSKLTGKKGKVQIPDFYDCVPAVTKAEQEWYMAISNTMIGRNPSLGDPKTYTAGLMGRWREPSLTIHRFKVSGSEANKTVISHVASAALSIRLVPNQETSKIKAALVSHMESAFAELESTNHLTITIEHEAEPWLGDPDNTIFKTLEKAVMEAWGPIGETITSKYNANQASNVTVPKKALPSTPSTSASETDDSENNDSETDSNHTGPAHQAQSTLRKPLYIREGGSIPAIRFLEKEFGAPAAHLPCGQASDNAHLDNERLRIVNLYKSREIFGRVFRDLGSK
ncbi:MAG: hypothetical protein M4579_000413 [Chaenotheca gracillima]|nr:MAG: hypothetical protein M4579_000413 [Chaenotheca gracillima]